MIDDLPDEHGSIVITHANGDTTAVFPEPGSMRWDIYVGGTRYVVASDTAWRGKPALDRVKELCRALAQASDEDALVIWNELRRIAGRGW